MHSSRCKSLCELTDSKDLALLEDNGKRQVGLDQNLRFFHSIQKEANILVKGGFKLPPLWLTVLMSPTFSMWVLHILTSKAYECYQRISVIWENSSSIRSSPWIFNVYGYKVYNLIKLFRAYAFISQVYYHRLSCVWSSLAWVSWPPLACRAFSCLVSSALCDCWSANNLSASLMLTYAINTAPHDSSLWNKRW